MCRSEVKWTDVAGFQLESVHMKYKILFSTQDDFRLHVLLLCIGLNFWKNRIMNNIISCGKASQQNDVFHFYDYTFGSWVHSMCDPFDHIGPPCLVPLFNNLDRFVLCFGPTLVWQPRLV